MNTNILKKFAQQTRIKLMEQISSKLEYVLQTDSPELREKSEQVNKLKEILSKSTKQEIVERVSYTWFNRLMALRFMDVNDYQPIGTKVVTPNDGYTLPEILDEAKRGHISDDLNLNRQNIFDILDGKIPSNDSQNEAYKALLIASCNHLSSVFPFLFERINDYTELLLPDDLTSELSIIQDVRDGMSAEDCQEVEIIGWLYQFYISEKNDELISSKKVYKKEELAPASQLFTPKWIVQYMVDNTLGQVWSEINPDTKITSELEFYIKPDYLDQLPKRKKKSIEEVKFFEPCTGSGHILSYAFDVFYRIYEEEGYNPTEIPELIITKNLFGVDIDERASQLASFVLLMKGRQKSRRFLRNVQTKKLQTNITYYQDFEFDNKFKNATALGSLIKIDENDLKNFVVEKGSIFQERQEEVKKLYDLLGRRYDVVVTNPPYISSSRMEGSLKKYVEENYLETKSDLFATFILRCLELCNEEGLTGYMTPFVWMFISSYEKLREVIIEKHFINNLIQLEYSGFDGATVPICTFTLRKSHLGKGKGTYIRLSDFKGSRLQAPKTLEAINDENCKYLFLVNQKDFEKIPGFPIGYWLNKNWLNIFKSKNLKDLVISDGQNITGDNDRYLRMFWEISANQNNPTSDWPSIAKGGSFRRWAGNVIEVISWSQKSRSEYKENRVARIQSEKLWFRSGITWNLITSTGTGFRLLQSNELFNKAAPTILFNKSDEKYLHIILGFLNTKITSEILKLLNPTLNTNIKEVLQLPCPTLDYEEIDKIVIDCVLVSSGEWNSKELSNKFQQNELLRLRTYDGIWETVAHYKSFWHIQFSKLHQNEEELNRQFIEIYGLQDELTPTVPLEDITILKEETVIQNGELVFKEDEILKQFVSYAVGCMFGRYSLDHEGLILANQGETLEDYLKRVGREKDQLTFVPDADNIIPVLDDEWFEDDIVNRFYAFLKVSFGAQNFDKNLAFVEESLGKDIRKYFIKDFYDDHIKRYKKRPIYWMFSSPKGSFNVLIYMHRYTPDTLNKILNGYLIQYREKLNTKIENLDHVIVTGSSAEQTKAQKEKDRLKLVIMELVDYEREILRPIAIDRIPLDLDDGVLVNYNKFGKAIKDVAGLNDAKTKKKVRGFDWINTVEIR